MWERSQGVLVRGAAGTVVEVQCSQIWERKKGENSYSAGKMITVNLFIQVFEA